MKNLLLLLPLTLLLSCSNKTKTYYSALDSCAVHTDVMMKICLDSANIALDSLRFTKDSLEKNRYENRSCLYLGKLLAYQEQLDHLSELAKKK